eukprot:TRINITY_DN15594_c0_g1_i1.p1 TRINITY_DN15594_c0_g1~~TRINITY_DN15594_c0_g1_i1.p1  ORF type:complete len:194 (-),score=29.27 TRINITY_DN15594_c0_g1_i1:396-977(-)
MYVPTNLFEVHCTTVNHQLAAQEALYCSSAEDSMDIAENGDALSQQGGQFGSYTGSVGHGGSMGDSDCGGGFGGGGGEDPDDSASGGSGQVPGDAADQELVTDDDEDAANAIPASPWLAWQLATEPVVTRPDHIARGSAEATRHGTKVTRLIHHCSMASVLMPRTLASLQSARLLSIITPSMVVGQPTPCAPV